jgi:hypothetical protein
MARRIGQTGRNRQCNIINQHRLQQAIGHKDRQDRGQGKPATIRINRANMLRKLSSCPKITLGRRIVAPGKPLNAATSPAALLLA